jgi:LPXTG-motif cell wall-anchored protein
LPPINTSTPVRTSTPQVGGGGGGGDDDDDDPPSQQAAAPVTTAGQLPAALPQTGAEPGSWWLALGAGLAVSGLIMRRRVRRPAKA